MRCRGHESVFMRRGLISDPEVPKQEEVAGTGTQGRNDNGEIGYMGPCPPSGTHRYYARLFALDTELGEGQEHLTTSFPKPWRVTFSRERSSWALIEITSA